MNQHQAVEAARKFLGYRYPSAPPTVVLRAEWATEYTWAWSVLFDTQERMASGNMMDAPMVRLLYVAKDGSVVDFMPTAFSAPQIHAFLETGRTPGGLPLLNPVPVHTRRARDWLLGVYGQVAELATDQPVAETAQAWWYGVRALPQPGYPTTAMLNASLIVPKNGSAPFHPANADPWGDVSALAGDPRPRLREQWGRTANARGCVVAVDAMIDGAQATALPWQPSHEAPGWWGRLIRRHFTGAEVLACPDWNTVLAAVGAGGPDTRGVVWVRRELGGHEATGHLLHAHNNGDRIVVLDGQTGGLARLDGPGVRTLTLARLHRPGAAG